MKVVALCIGVFSIVGFVYGAVPGLPILDLTVPELTVPEPGSEVVDPCILNRPECSLVKLASESSWNIGELLGIQYISYGDFWKLVGCTCEVTGEAVGTLTCGLNTIILDSCPCYGCIPLDGN